ncbi:MAG: metallophosphoesterase [Polyangiales bacterium]
MSEAPKATPIAFMSDIHGNAKALKAVLDELARQDVRVIYAAGDHLLGGDEPLETWRLLQKANVQCARGLSELAMLRVDPDELSPTGDEEFAKVDQFIETRRALGDLILEQIRRLEPTLRVPLIDGRELLVVHGSPSDPLGEISHDASDEELEALVSSDPADIVVCGASHVAFRRDIEGTTILSVGSVGASPSGVAHFTVVRPRMDGLEVHQDHVEYA